MYPVSPSAQETVTSWPSRIRCVASPQPTTAGMPSSRAMMAAWQGRPPRVVTIARAGLEDVEQAVAAVLAPLDVHRAAVVLLDDHRVPSQFDDVGIGERIAIALLGRRV